MEIADLSHKFRTEKPHIYARASELTDKNTILAAIAGNIPLFNSYMRAICERYSELAEALFNLEPDSVLIYFAELKLYGLFTPQNYSDFCRNLADKIEDKDLTVNVYQLVLTEEKQKLVFICTDKEYYLKLHNYSTGCFGVAASQISQDNDQITVNTICSGDVEIISAYNKLYNYIRCKGDYQCCDVMKQVQLLQKFQHSYREYRCNETIDTKSLELLVATLKNIPNGAHIEQLNIAINQNVINGDQHIINFDDKKKFARKWIVENPPEEKEFTTSYYDRYCKNFNYRLHINQFGKLVADENFIRKSNGKERYWVKK